MLSLHLSDIHVIRRVCLLFTLMFLYFNLKSDFTVLNVMSNLLFGNFALSIGFLYYSVSTAVFRRSEL